LFELPVTSDSGTNNVTPFAVTPCPNPFNWRGWFSSFTCHCTSNPGLPIASTEMAASFRIQDVRWASPCAVNHSDPPPRT
jgi:hypothetical protein